jgi:fibronectin-binding autotransporter adhesin
MRKNVLWVPRVAIFLCAVMALCIAVQPAAAATYTYTATSGANVNWSAGTNWSATPVSSSDAVLVFTTSGTLANADTNTQNIGRTADTYGGLSLGGFQAQSLTLAGTGSATININSTAGTQYRVNLGIGAPPLGAGAAPVVNLDAGAGVVYNLSLGLGAQQRTLRVQGSGGGTFNFMMDSLGQNGSQSSSGLDKAGSSTMILLGSAGSGYGATHLIGGTIQVGNGGTLGRLSNGAILVNSGQGEGGNLVFQHSDTYTLSNSLADADTGLLIRQQGIGTLTLNNSGNSSGGFRISVDNGVVRANLAPFLGSTFSFGTVTIVGTAVMPGSGLAQPVNSGILSIGNWNAGNKLYTGSTSGGISYEPGPVVATGYNPGSAGILALNVNNNTLNGTNNSLAFIGAIGGTMTLSSAVLNPGGYDANPSTSTAQPVAGVRTYRLGGGGGTLNITTNNLITNVNPGTGAVVANVKIGSNNVANGALIGGGTVIFAGTTNYSGTTKVNVGTLLVNAAQTGVGNYFVTPTSSLSDAVLGGTSTITLGTATTSTGMTVTGALGSRGIIAPGTDGTIGTLSFASAAAAAPTVAFGSGGQLKIDFNATSADLFAITGNVSMVAGSSLALNQLAAPTANSYQLMTWTGTRTGTFDSVVNSVAGYTLSYKANELDLQKLGAIGTVTASTSGVTNVLLNGKATLAVTVQNSGAGGTADINVTGNGVTKVVGGPVGPVAVAAGATNPVNGLSFSSSSYGAGQSGTLSITDTSLTVPTVNATVSGMNVGLATPGQAMSAALAGGEDMSGLASKTLANGAAHLLGTEAMIMGGDYAGTAHQLTETWRARTAGEGTSLISDVVNVAGMTAGTQYVLAVDYTAGMAAAGSQRLSWYNGSAWVNAGSINMGNTPWFAWDGVGSYGYFGGKVWAVTTNQGAFAAVPEPSTLVLLATGLIGLLVYVRRRP